MIKNKEILAIIERKNNEVSCANCKHCNLGARYSGKWYCKNPNISVFEPPMSFEECFERKEK